MNRSLRSSGNNISVKLDKIKANEKLKNDHKIEQ